MRRKLIRHLGSRIGSHQHVATRNVDLLGESYRHGITDFGDLARSVITDNAANPRCKAGRGHDDCVANSNAAGRDGAGIAAKIRGSAD